MQGLKPGRTVWNTSVPILSYWDGPVQEETSFQFEEYPYKILKVIQAEVKINWKKWCLLTDPNHHVLSPIVLWIKYLFNVKI